MVRARAAVRRLRAFRDIRSILDTVTVELCEACRFDRAMVSRVEGSTIVVESAHDPRDPELAAKVLAYAQTSRPRLDHLLIETEMVRRRAPILVADTQREPRAHTGFVELLQPRSYVAAPIMPQRRVIGFLHADLFYSDRAPDEVDRDLLWTFADGFAYALERTILLQRLRTQLAQIGHALGSAEALASYGEVEFAGLTASEVPLQRRPEHDPPLTTAGAVADILTRRELEVVELLTAGASNAQIAERLIVSPATVKSHVARILRKLGVSNRAEAVSRYFTLGRDRAA
jgi:DNA-binding CsgD family transcriptional regulator